MLAQDYILRRAKLSELLPKDSIVVIYARDLLQRSPTIPYPFNQFSDFLYLTGQTKPCGVLTMCTTNNKLESSLFIPKISHDQEMWAILSNSNFEETQKLSGVDSVFPLSDFSKWISSHITQNNKNNVFASLPPHQSAQHPFRMISPYLDQLKVIKSDKEIQFMKKASSITTESMNEVLKTVKPGIYERQIAARFEYMCIKRGATGFAYPVECQSGTNALSLHNIENSSKLKEGQALLIDAGCEYQGYASDFSRTVPIGKVNPAIDAALKIVERIKNDLISLVRSKKVGTLNQLNNVAEQKLIKGLNELGIKADQKNISQYFPHRVSHWIGLDVHDARTVGGDFEIRKGCAFSVEPGLYFSSTADACPQELKGVGIRFEDTVIIE